MMALQADKEHMAAVAAEALFPQQEVGQHVQHQHLL
jgi:hypothetical protein